jgi:3-dehydroquinate synthetase
MASEDSEIYKISIFGKDTIFVGLGITLAIVEDLNNHLSASIYALLTDKNVELLYLQEFEQVFKSFNLRLLHKVVEPGVSLFKT